MIGDPDEETLARVKAFYNAIAVLIEKECGHDGGADGAPHATRASAAC